MSTPAPPTPALVEADTPCRNCSYNLRSLPVTGICPECGTPVGAAIYGNLLRYSLPTWVRSLARGARLLYWGSTMFVVTFIIFFLFFLIAMVGAFVRPAFNSVFAMSMVMVPLTLVAGLMLIVGWWLLTEPDPSLLGEDRYGASRKLIRITLVIQLAEDLLNRGNFAQSSIGIHRIFLGIDLAASLAFAIGLAAQLRYIEELCQRIPEAKISKDAGKIKNSLPNAYAIMSLAGSYQLFITVGFPSFPNAREVLPAIVGIAALLMIAFSYSYWKLLGPLSRRLATEAAQSKALWNSARTPPPIP